MSSSYTELRYFRSQDQVIGTLHPALAQDTSLRHDLGTPDKAADRLLLELCQGDDVGAFLCLRCHVSHALEMKARDLAETFRPSGLQFQEVASFALLDDGDRRRSTPLSYLNLRQQPEDSILPFSAQVICSYAPERGAGLPYWAKFRLQSYGPLKEFLRDVYGLVLISDWALLADSSPTRMRKAWPLLSAPSLSLEQTLVLHGNFRRGYSQDRQLHRSRHGRSGGYTPSENFLLEIQPQKGITQTHDELRSMATAIRRYMTPGWQRQLSQATGKEGDETVRDPVESVQDPRNFDDSDDGSSAQLDQIRSALERALDQYMPAVIRPATSDPMLLCLWRGFAAGVSNRPNGEHCGCSCGQVSRKLRSNQHATAVARCAAGELSRLSAFEAIATSADGAERMVEALRNQLLQPAQEGKDSFPNLQQWVQRHLPQP